MTHPIPHLSNKENTKQRTHLFRTYSNKKNTKQQSTIPHLFQQRNTKQRPQLFRTFSNKETTKQRPGTEIGVEAGADCSAGRRTWADPLYLKFRIKYLRVRLITRIQ